MPDDPFAIGLQEAKAQTPPASDDPFAVGLHEAATSTAGPDRSIPGEFASQAVSGVYQTVRNLGGLARAGAQALGPTLGRVAGELGLGAAGPVVSGALQQTGIPQAIEGFGAGLEAVGQYGQERMVPPSPGGSLARQAAGFVGRSAFPMATSIGGAVAAGPIGPAAALGVFAGSMAAPAAGAKFNEALDVHGDPEKALQEATAAGLTVAATSALTGGVLGKAIPGLHQHVANAAARVAAEAGAVGGAVGLQTLVDRVATDAISGAIRDDPVKYDAAYWKSVGLESLANAVVSGVAGAAGGLRPRGVPAEAVPEPVQPKVGPAPEPAVAPVAPSGPVAEPTAMPSEPGVASPARAVAGTPNAAPDGANLAPGVVAPPATAPTTPPGASGARSQSAVADPVQDAIRGVMEQGDPAKAFGGGLRAASDILAPAVSGAPPEPGKAPRRERLAAVWNRVKGDSLPTLNAAAPGVAEAGVRFATAAQTAAPLTDAILAETLGTKAARNPQELVRFGAAMVEDSLRGDRAKFAAAGDAEAAGKVRSIIGQEGSPFADEAAYQAFRESPEFRDFAQKWRDQVNPFLDENYRQTQRIDPDVDVPLRGAQDGLVINRIGVDPEAPAVEPGLRRLFNRTGDLTNPQRRKSPFARTATGSAEAYELNLREMLENRLRRTLESGNRNAFYDALVKSGDAVLLKAPPDGPVAIKGEPGAFIAEIAHKPYAMTDAEGKATGAGLVTERLFVRKSLEPEIRQLLNTDSPLQKGVATRVGQALNTVQIAGVTDAVFHTANVFSAIAGSPGGSNALVGIARRLPGVNVIDATYRMLDGAKKAIQAKPETLRQIAEMSEVGGMPPRAHSRFIRGLNTMSRVALDDMYGQLVKRGLAEDSPGARREFLNQAGNYTARLMPRYQRLMRDSGASPFIVAGTTFNRFGAKKMLMAPGVRTASRKADAQLRAEAATGIVMTAATAALLNYMTTGEIGGRDGTPLGAIDTGQDDEHGKHIVVDPFKWTGVRRGTRISGVGPAVEALRHGREPGAALDEGARATVDALLHPLTGPALTFGFIAATGRDPTVELRGESHVAAPGESQVVQNIIAGLKQANPMLEGAIEELQGGSGVGAAVGKGGILRPITGAVGVKHVGEGAETTAAAEGARLKEFAEDVVRRARKLPDGSPRPMTDRLPFLLDQVKDLDPKEQQRVKSEALRRGLFKYQ